MKKKRIYKVSLLLTDCCMGTDLEEKEFKSKSKALNYYLKIKSTYANIKEQSYKNVLRSFESDNKISDPTVYCSFKKEMI